jgi:hypothetical protein
MTFLEHEGWAQVLGKACALFVLGVILLTLRGKKKNRRVTLPKPSDKCRRNGPESLP